MEKDKEFNSLQIEGRNAVTEAIRSERSIDKIFIQKDATGSLKQIATIAKERKILVKIMTLQQLNELSQTKKHQGVIAFAAAHNYVEVQDILQTAKDKGEKPFIIVLDGITDPHNLGAIIRTVNAVGAHGVIIPARRAVGVNSTVEKTSAGAVSYVQVAKVTNIAATIKALKAAGLWAVCATLKGRSIYETDLNFNGIALVIGSEGEGVSRIVESECDVTVSIPMYGQTASLNASVAAGIAMYEIVRQQNR